MARHPIHDGLFTEDPSPALVIGKCRACGRLHFPKAPSCPFCGARDIGEMLASSGTLWGWTAVTARPAGYEGSVPYGFGIVALDDVDLRVVTMLEESDPAALAFGARMRLVVRDLYTDESGDTITTFSFASNAAHGAAA